MDDVREQRLAALRLANDVRRARAELKRQIADGVVSVAETLRHPSTVAARCSVLELLMSQRRWGRRKSAKFLAACAISESKSVGDLTERQRELLVEQLQ